MYRNVISMIIVVMEEINDMTVPIYPTPESACLSSLEKTFERIKNNIGKKDITNTDFIFMHSLMI